MSNAMKRLAATFAGRHRPCDASAVPSPGAAFSPTAQRAVRGADQRRAVGRDQPAQDGAAGFHQFGADHDVDLARRRHQRQHGRLPARLASASGAIISM